MEIKKLEKRYSEVLLSCRCLEIKETGLYFLKGPNGSGKTTLLNMLSGLDKNYDGDIEGIRKVSYYKQNTIIPSHMSFSSVLSLTNEFNIEIVKELLISLEVSNLIYKKSTDLSIGEKQRLEIILVLSKNAQIYLLDEPYSALNKTYVKVINEHLKKISSARCVIFTSHLEPNLDQVDGLLYIRNKTLFLKYLNVKNNKNTYFDYQRKRIFDIKNIHYFIFNKVFFFINFINLVFAFCLLYLAKDFDKLIFTNIEYQNSYIFVTEKYFSSKDNLQQFFEIEKISYDCDYRVCYFSSNKDIKELNKKYPLLHFYNPELEIINNLKIKIDNEIKTITNTLNIISLFSFFTIIICEYLIFLLNKRKHENLKKHLQTYKLQLVLFYSLMIIVSLILSKLTLKIIYKKLLS